MSGRGNIWGRPIEFQTLETGCIVPTNFKTNPDGYFYKRINGKRKAYHRYAYEQRHGVELPVDKEVHHKCGNRKCCNPDHLEVVNQGAHQARTNFERYRSRFVEAHQYWKETGCNGMALAKAFNVGTSTSYRWIKHWQKHGELIFAQMRDINDNERSVARGV